VDLPLFLSEKKPAFFFSKRKEELHILLAQNFYFR